MRKKNIIFIVLAAAFFIVSMPAIADEIVPNSEDLGSVYADHKAMKIGDIVTVVVIESTQGYNSASLKTSKQQSLNGGIGISTWGGGVSSSFPYSPAWGMGGQESQDGTGKSTRAGGLMAKISARVEKVLSNGNLSIKGAKIVQVNDEKQNLVITGTIRPEDIAADNTVLSTFVADAHIEYEGKGPVGEKTSPGFLTRILDWLGIF